jgi:hypothetical protein
MLVIRVIAGPECFAAAISPCLLDSGVPQVKPIQIEGTSYHVEICQLPEDSKHRYPSRIEIRNDSTLLADYIHLAGPTGGYVSEVAIQAKNDRFVAISFDAGEFCNGLVFFDLRERKIAGRLICASDLALCHVNKLGFGKRCETDIRCQNQVGDGEPSAKPPFSRTLFLCGSTPKRAAP